MIFQIQKTVNEDADIVRSKDINGDLIGDDESSENVLFSDHLILRFNIVCSSLSVKICTSTAYLQSPFPFLVYCLQKSLATELTYDITCLAYPRACVSDTDCD